MISLNTVIEFDGLCRSNYFVVSNLFVLGHGVQSKGLSGNICFSVWSEPTGYISLVLQKACCLDLVPSIFLNSYLR